MDAINKMEAERREIDILLERGIHFETEKRGIFKRLSKNKFRKWEIKQPYLGTLDAQAKYQIKMDIDEQAMQEQPLLESKRMVYTSVKNAAMVIAIAVLNSKWKIKWLSWFYKNYFLWHLKPDDLYSIAKVINTMNNYLDFTISIRLMSGSRITKPKETGTLIETKSSPNPKDLNQHTAYDT